MLGSEDTKLHSPITPLSFDFDKKKRSKQQQLLKRCNSPDILNRSSHDLVSRTERMRASEENLRSSGYSEAEADYAPVSTERWIRDDSQGDHLQTSHICSNSHLCYRGPGAPSTAEAQGSQQCEASLTRRQRSLSLPCV